MWINQATENISVTPQGYVWITFLGAVVETSGCVGTASSPNVGGLMPWFHSVKVPLSNILNNELFPMRGAAKPRTDPVNRSVVIIGLRWCPQSGRNKSLLIVTAKTLRERFKPNQGHWPLINSIRTRTPREQPQLGSSQCGVCMSSLGCMGFPPGTEESIKWVLGSYLPPDCLELWQSVACLSVFALWWTEDLSRVCLTFSLTLSILHQIPSASTSGVSFYKFQSKVGLEQFAHHCILFVFTF